MIDVVCPHCELALAVREETAGRKFQCPACLHLFTVPVPKPNTNGSWRVRPIDSPEPETPKQAAALEPPPAKPRRKGKRKKEKGRRRSAPPSPSDAVLWIGGISLLLVGVMIGLVAGHRLWSHAEMLTDDPLAELEAADDAAQGTAAAEPATPGDVESVADAGGPGGDPNSPEEMILGKWVVDIVSRWTYDFRKDGTFTATTTAEGRKINQSGKYKITSATTLWMKGPTGEATMDMKLTPDELELTIHTKGSVETNAGSDPTEKTSKPIDITLRFKRPGAVPDPPPAKAQAKKPDSPAGPSGSPKGGPGRTQPPKTSPRGPGRGS